MYQHIILTVSDFRKYPCLWRARAVFRVMLKTTISWSSGCLVYFKQWRRSKTVFWRCTCGNCSDSCRCVPEFTTNHCYSKRRRPGNSSCLQSTWKAFSFSKTQNRACEVEIVSFHLIKRSTQSHKTYFLLVHVFSEYDSTSVIHAKGKIYFWRQARYRECV